MSNLNNLEVINMQDILNNMNLSEEDYRLYEDMVGNLEKIASENLRKNKIVNIPNIGNIRKNPVKEAIKNQYATFRIARKYMTKEEYKDYVRSSINLIKETEDKKEKDKIRFRKIKTQNKNKYETLFSNLGKSYAEMYIYSIYLMNEVPFDSEWEEHYKSLKY